MDLYFVPFHDTKMAQCRESPLREYNNLFFSFRYSVSWLLMNTKYKTHDVNKYGISLVYTKCYIAITEGLNASFVPNVN